MTAESWGSDDRSRVISDPLALRALAHPLRMKIHGLVAREGTITAADAARQLGISQALASHHLHQLAKYGFVEPAESDDQRSRPWRVTATSTFFEPEEPEGRAASDLMQRWTVEQAVAQLAEWQDRRSEVDERWTELTELMSGLVYLTVDEMEELREALVAVIAPLVRRRRVGDHEQRPDGAVPVSFTVITVPVPTTEHGG